MKKKKESGKKEKKEGELLPALALLLPRALGPQIRVKAFPTNNRILRVARLALLADQSAGDLPVSNRKLAHFQNTFQNTQIKANKGLLQAPGGI